MEENQSKLIDTQGLKTFEMEVLANKYAAKETIGTQVDTAVSAALSNRVATADEIKALFETTTA